MVGTVKFFKVDQGYGFISTLKGEYFVHATKVVDGPLERGQLVEFELGPGRNGDSNAIQVRRIQESAE